MATLRNRSEQLSFATREREAVATSERRREASRSERSELSRTITLFGLLFLAGLVFVVGRTARDALFLTKYPVSWVGPMWMVYAIVSSLVALVATRLALKLPRVSFGAGFALVAAASYAILRAMMAEEIRAASAIFYVWSDVISNLAAVVGWTIAQEYHDARSAKRLFAVIGAGQVTGIILCGFGASALVRLVGTENLLVVLAAALVAFACLVAVVSKRHPLPEKDAALVKAEASVGEALRSPYVVAIAAFVLVLFTALTVGDYQFKAILRTSFPERDELASFAGKFHGSVGVLGLVLQLALTPWILKRFGVVAGMLALPLAFLSTSIGLFLFPSLALAALLKASDNGLQLTIHDATLQLLFFPFPSAMRARVRTTIAAVMKPVGCGVGALVLLAFAPSGPAATPGPELVLRASRLAFATVPLLFVALAIVPFVRRGYVASMRRTLVRRDAEHDELALGPTAKRVLAEALASEDAPQVMYAIERLRGVDPERLRASLEDLANHGAPRVRRAALRLAIDLRDPRAAALARRALSDEDGSVRIAAVEALALELREDAHDELVSFLDREDVALRTAAIAALVRHAGLDGILDGAPRLRALLDSPDRDDRIEAAHVLGMIGGSELQRSLAKLLVDDDPAVRRAALEAAPSTADARLLPLLFEALDTRAHAALAATAIVALGDAAVPKIGAMLSDSLAPRAVRLVLPRLLFRIGTRSALDALLERIDEPDEQVRQKVLASASRLRLALHAPALPFSEASSRIDRTIAEHVRVRDDYLSVRPRLARPLLDELVVLRLRKGVIRVLRLCELVYPREVVAAARVHLFGSDAALRANALEVLESLLDRSLRERLVAIVDALDVLRRGEFRAPKTPPTDERVRAWLRAELASADPYRVALALESIAYRRVTIAGKLALPLLSHDHPLVRETAAIAIAATKPAGAEEALRDLAEDPDASVAAYAEYWRRTGSAGIDPEDLMYTTIEKVLFLQRVPVFSRASGEDLVTLARGASVVHASKGETLFKEGDPGGSLFFIISGAVRLTVKGREVASLATNDVFGELSIFDRAPRQITANVEEESELLCVSSESFREAVRESAEVAEAVIQVLGRRLHEADQRIVALGGRFDAAAKRDHRDDDEME